MSTGFLWRTYATCRYSVYLQHRQLSQGDPTIESSGNDGVVVEMARVGHAFSASLLMQLECLRFCGFGEAREVTANGNFGPSGSVAFDPTSDSMGESCILGLNLTIEPTRQLRGDAFNQLDDPECASGFGKPNWAPSCIVMRPK
jgi:hypothetical protein